jgi:hypothetical protein
MWIPYMTCAPALLGCCNACNAPPVQTHTLLEQWSSWTKVGVLDVAHNQLSGTLPAAYQQMRPSVDPQLTTLTYWDFSNNL